MITATISGNIGKDAELRNVGHAGATVANFSVASTRKVKDEKITTWVRCALWGKRGEALCRYLTKGTRVAVAGELSTREHDGKTHLELEVFGVDLLGGGERSDGRADPAPRDNPRPAPRPAPVDDYGADDQEDLPF